MAWLNIASKTARERETRLVVTPTAGADDEVERRRRTQFGIAVQSFPGIEQRVAWQAHVGGFLAGLILFALFDPGRVTRRPAFTPDRVAHWHRFRRGQCGSSPMSRPNVPDRIAAMRGSLPLSHSRKFVFDWLRHRLRSGGHGIRRLCAVFRDLTDPSPPVGGHYMISGTEIGLVAPSVLVNRVRDCKLPPVDTATINLAVE
jgi:hypothetical protein